MGISEWSWGPSGDNGILSADHTAIAQPNGLSWDYRRLERVVRELGATLRSWGLHREDTVAVAMPDGAAGLITQLAVMSVCASAPLNPLLTETELRRDLTELGVRSLICDPDFATGLQIAADMGLIAIAASMRGDDLGWQRQPGRAPGQ